MLINEVTEHKFAYLDRMSPEQRSHRIDMIQHADRMSHEERAELDYLMNMNRKPVEHKPVDHTEHYKAKLASLEAQLEKAMDQAKHGSELQSKMLKGFMIPKLIDNIEHYKKLLNSHD